MKLKEMNSTSVTVEDAAELVDYLWFCKDRGWYKKDNDNGRGYIYPCNIAIQDGVCFSFGTRSRVITLAEFKKEQNIMKYKEGDFIINRDGSEREILGVCGKIYFTTPEAGYGRADEFSGTFTEATLDRYQYTLKTETTKTDMTVSEIENALGKAAGSLNVVAE